MTDDHRPTYAGRCWCSSCVLDRYWLRREASAVARVLRVLAALTS